MLSFLVFACVFSTWFCLNRIRQDGEGVGIVAAGINALLWQLLITASIINSG